MGCLHYGDHGTAVTIDDRALTHLQIVIINKLRRGESFAFSWTEPTSTGSGRSTIWLHPMVTLRFKFAGNRVPSVNVQWLAQLTELANSSAGLRCTAEPADTSAPHTTPDWYQPDLLEMSRQRPQRSRRTT
jgi:hypothetical protein